MQEVTSNVIAVEVVRLVDSFGSGHVGWVGGGNGGKGQRPGWQ